MRHKLLELESELAGLGGVVADKVDLLINQMQCGYITANEMNKSILDTTLYFNEELSDLSRKIECLKEIMNN